MGTGNSATLLVHIEISVVQFCASDSSYHLLMLLGITEIAEKLLVQNKISVSASLLSVGTSLMSMEGAEISLKLLE